MAKKPCINVVTIGQDGHGKTTVTAAITKVLEEKGTAKAVTFDEINNAQEEKKNGIPIKMSRVEYETENRHYAHVDCHGHAEIVKNLVTGAAQIDVGILVVSATDGPTQQTREHIFLARQVGVPYLICFLNKADVVSDTEILELAASEIRELLASYGFSSDTPVVQGPALSALEGNNENMHMILNLMNDVDSEIPDPLLNSEKPFLMPIEDVFTTPGRGPVATGPVERGIIKPGDEVEIIGPSQNKRTIVTGVEIIKKPLESGQAVDNTGLILGYLNFNEVSRGMVIAKQGTLKTYAKFEAEIYVLAIEEGGRDTPFSSDYSPQIYTRTINVFGKVELPENVETVMPGDHITVVFELIHPVPLEEGQRFSLMEGGRTVGAGVVSKVVS